MSAKTTTGRTKYVLIDESERFSFIVTYLTKVINGLTTIVTGTIKQKEFFDNILPYFNIK
jgi:hypothetical protein